MAQSILSSVGSSLVAVVAGSSTWQVSIAQVPGQAGAFSVYDANQNLLATINGPGSYQWNASQTGSPFAQGQVVGYVSVPTGTQNFIVRDSNQVPFVPPVGGVALPAAGAIAEKSGRVFLTGATAQAYTITAPTPGVDDFKELEIINASGQAHTVTGPAGCFAGGLHIATFAAAFNQHLVLVALNGVWHAQVAPLSGAVYAAGVVLT